MKSNHYKKRVYELRSEGLSLSDVSKKIHEEYDIQLSLNRINKIGSSSTNKTEDLTTGLNKTERKAQMILSILTKSQIPLSAKEISKTIRKEYQHLLPKGVINKTIFRNLREKVNYNRQTFKYSIIKQSSIDEMDINEYKDGLVNDSLKLLLSELSEVDFFNELKSYFKGTLINVSTGIPQMDDLIKLVVKDNLITECEELFLKSKAVEHGYSEDIIEAAKKSLDSNNPYLDNLIHIIFEDGIITSEELMFLREKTQENGFSSSFVNERFWTIGLAEYTQHVVKINGLDKALLIFIILLKFDSNLFNINKLYEHLDLFQEKSLSEIIESALDNFSNDLNLFFQSKYNLKYDYSTFLTDNFKFLESENVEEINLDTDQSVSSSMEKFLKMLNQERLRIGSPDVNLLAENIVFRIENNLWD